MKAVARTAWRKCAALQYLYGPAEICRAELALALE